MAEVGWMGAGPEDSGVYFMVSRETVRTLSNWKWSGSARWPTHERHLTDALTEFTGLDPDEISFDIQVSAELGVRPLDEVKRIWRYEREGIPVALTVGEHFYGKYRWSIVSHSTAMEYTDVNGNLYSVTISVKMQEYMRA